MGRVAAIQMTSSHVVADNLAAAAGLLREAKDLGCEVACLPENFSFIGLRDADKLGVAEADGEGPVQSFLSETARELKLWILGGTIVIRGGRGGRVANSSLLFDAAGRRVARYDKIHLFDVTIPGRDEQYRESTHVAAGRDLVIADTPVGKLGLSVCYDMRFPELYRELVARGAEWLAMPAAFTVPTGRAHWETLLRARAIENLCYVVAPAQSGTHTSGRETYGDSLIVDYWGQVLCAPGEGCRSDHSRHRSCQGSGDACAFSGARQPAARAAPRRGGVRMNARSADTGEPMFEVAEKMILAPSGLDEGRLSTVLDAVMSRGVDYADLYFQLSREESWSLEDGIVKEGSHSIEQGVGVRAISGEKTGFAYTDEVLLPALLEASSAARAIARSGGRNAVKAWQRPLTHRLYLPIDPLDAVRDEDKVAWLMRIDADTRRIDPRVKQVMASLAAVHEVILIATSDGTLTADVRPLVRVNVSVIVEQNGRREQGYSGGGGRFGLDELLRGDEPLAHGREAVRQALVNLDAVAAPAGSMTVVLGPGWPGILLHEAIGHGLEGDFNRKGTSAFSNRIGQKVAADEITVVDDGTLDRRRGSLNVDDEGTPTQCTTLIEKGVLRGYIQDKMNARLMGMPATGNGRRESFAHMTLPRMTNTYMRAGARAPEEIIASVEKGLYAVNFGGGQVDITSGKFVFSASEAYLIENGKIGAPVKGATLIGNGPDVLQRVSMVGNDMKLDGGVGTCGKEGQSVPVGVGQPTLRVDALTVGGTG